MEEQRMTDELKPCPFCGKEIDEERDMYIPERDWKPTFYDPDSGGDPICIHCECGLEFSTGTYDYQEFLNAWNRRVQTMNEQQAINVMEKYTDISLSKVVIEAHNMAISALEKQIPKKPIVKPWDVARCPTCGFGLSEHIGDGYYKHYTHWEYCHNPDCLQKLDWSE